MRNYGLVVLGLLLSNSLGAQQFEINKTTAIPSSSIRPTIDGELTEAEWSDARVIDDLYQVQPDEYAAPTERTEFFIKFDEDFIYVAAKAYETNPDNIVAQVNRQGANMRDDDTISIVLDPYNSKRAGYRFIINPNSSRNEGIFINITELQSDWSTIWEGRSQLTDYGWSTEMAIPFKSLSFSTDINTWGVNFLRKIARYNEMDAWVSQNRSYDVSVSGAISGFENMDQGLGLDVVPGISFVNTRDYNPQIDDHNVEPSVNMFYKVTPSLNAALTFNTDFSATEVDDQQVDIGQFGLFFPEKRDFFLREFDIFDFGGIGTVFDQARWGNAESNNSRPFFSRRIGLSPSGEAVDLIAGGKISGKVDRYEIGALVVQQDEFVPRDPMDPRVDSSTLFVGRAAMDVLEESSIGAIFTSGDPQSNNNNSLAGVDFRYRKSSSPLGRIVASSWYQQSDTPGMEGDDSAWELYFSVPNDTGWQTMAQYQRVGENFNPAMGYASRRGVDLYRTAAGYTLRFPGHDWIESIYAGITDREWSYLDDGTLQSSFRRIKLFNLGTRSDDRVQLLYTRRGEGIWADQRQPLGRLGIDLPFGEIYYSEYELFLQSSSSRPVNAQLQIADGDYYTGERLTYAFKLGWSINNKFSVSGEYEYWDVVLPEGQFELRTANARAEWAFTSNLSWVNVVQYNNIDANLGVNSRLHWQPKSGQNVYFVINHNFNELEDDEFVSTSNEITLKASYTFRF